MKLIKTENVIYSKYLFAGSLTLQEENKPLAAMLKTIKSNGLKAFLEDENLKNFARGLRNSFEGDGYLNAKGALTAEGLNVIETGRAWKKLSGIFELSLVTAGSKVCIIDVNPKFDCDINGYALTDNHFEKALAGEYSNDRGMHVKEVKLKNKCVLLNTSTEEMICEYDYDSNGNAYQITVGDKKIKFEDKTQKFRTVDVAEATELLENVLENYELTYSGKKVWIGKYSEKNKLLNAAVEEVFNKGSFKANSPDGSYSVTGIRLNVKTKETAKELLLKYLLNHAQKEYLGYSEITTLMSEFFALFGKCAEVPENLLNIYAALTEKASVASSKTAWLRLCAYKDLLPESIQSQYRLGSVKNFTGQIITMSRLVEELLGRGEPVSTVTVLTKFSHNPKILRAFNLFGNVLGRKGAQLKLITSSDNIETTYDEERKANSKKYLAKLEENGAVTLSKRYSKDFYETHDRFYRIERVNGSVEWWTMTGELDALRFDDIADFDAVDENTEGSVKEMTFSMLDKNGVSKAVKELMESVK